MTSRTGAPSTAPKLAAKPPDRGALAVEYQRLVELNQAKDRFLQTVSHELRTPLTSILSCTELLADARTGGLSGDQRELVDIVGRSAGRLLRLVNDLLELAGLEAGRLALRRELIELTDLVATVAQRRHPALLAAGLEFRLDVEAGPPVYADAERIGQLLDNLLSNAEKYTPAGGRVTVAGRPTGDGWEVSVTDTGIGIPAADHRTVFDEFARAANARAAGALGTGLGLAVSRTIAEKHGGTLVLRSEEGVGTTVTLRLPFAYRPGSPAPPAPPAPDPAGRPGPGLAGR
jgi:signal transduction histidine kinase